MANPMISQSSKLMDNLSPADLFELHIRFDVPLSTERLEFPHYHAVKNYLVEILQKSIYLIKSRKDTGHGNHYMESAIATTATINLLRSLLEELEKEHNVTNPRYVVEDLLQYFANARTVSRDLIEKMDYRIINVQLKRVMGNLLLFFVFTIIMPVVIAALFPKSDPAKMFEKICPYLFGIFWGWTEDVSKKKILELTEEKEVGGLILRIARSIPDQMQKYLYSYYTMTPVSRR